MANELYRLPPGGRNTATGVWFGALGAVATAIFLSLWAATQYTAWRFRFPPAFGRPLLLLPHTMQDWLWALGLGLTAVVPLCLFTPPGRSRARPLGLLAICMLV